MMENKKGKMRKTSGLILIGTTVAGVASAASNMASAANFSESLNNFNSEAAKRLMFNILKYQSTFLLCAQLVLLLLLA